MMSMQIIFIFPEGVMLGGTKSDLRFRADQTHFKQKSFTKTPLKSNDTAAMLSVVCTIIVSYVKGQ